MAIDPSVRTPFTCFDPQGYVYEIGNKDFGRIKRLCYHTNDLQSRFSERDVRKRRYLMRRAWLRMHRRVRNLVDRLHRKTVKWLCESYRVIPYPHYETSNTVIHEKRTDDQHACVLRGLSSKTARAMPTRARYRFKQHLCTRSMNIPGAASYSSTRLTLPRSAASAATSTVDAFNDKIPSGVVPVPPPLTDFEAYILR
jgi:putative transposase